MICYLLCLARAGGGFFVMGIKVCLKREGCDFIGVFVDQSIKGVQMGEIHLMRKYDQSFISMIFLYREIKAERRRIFYRYMLNFRLIIRF